jgi:hypothetical protein
MLRWLKNPIVLGVLAFLLVYLYCWYEMQQKNESTKRQLEQAVSQGVLTSDQANKQLRSASSVSLFKPLVVGILVWLIAYYLVSNNSGDYESSDSDITIDIIPCSVLGSAPRLI